MHEDFLHYLWKYQLFSNRENLSLAGEKVEVVHPGEHNSDAGPDFFNARVRMGDTLWVGNVEIHLKSSDWLRHKHQLDRAYDNVILHVVAQHDREITRINGEVVPTLVIESPKDLYKQYTLLMQNEAWIPCRSFIGQVNAFTFLQWKEALLVERLQDKAEKVAARYAASGRHLEHAFYVTLAHNFGFKTNALPFELLAQSLPWNLLAKHRDQLPLVEAMLFGQAGLLPEENSDAYVHQLKKDYQHLQAKFSLEPLQKSMWKFMRMRPANFPTLRIAQFAGLVQQASGLFARVLDCSGLEELQKLFQPAVSSFWENHYTFGEASAPQKKVLGKEAFQNIVINTIAPVLFFYGQLKKRPEYSEQALDLLSHLPAENNALIRGWKEMQVSCENAFDSQALIQLKNVYCKHRKCLHCRVGDQVLKETIYV